MSNVIKNIFPILFVLSYFVSINSVSAESKIRLGWQIPWATQGQLVMGLKHTNALELVNLDVEFIGFTYGAPLNSAALAGNVDILLTADQPALVLLSRDPSFRIVARMMYNRACIYVPKYSKINSLSELTGKNIMGPIGAAAERIAIDAIRKKGVNLSKVNFGQLDMAHQVAILRQENSDIRLKGIDALFGFDPLAAAFQETNKVRTLECGKITSVIIASEEMIKHKKDELEKFLSAFALSWHFYASNPNLANSLFLTESRLDVSNEVLDLCASIEPNRFINKFEKLNLEFSIEDRKGLKEVSTFLSQRKIIKKYINPDDYIDLSALQNSLIDPDLTDKIHRLKYIDENI